MSVRYVVRHETRYRYDREVAHSHQLFHLTPRDGTRQHCLRHEIRIEPVPAVRSEFIDAFGNRVTRAELDRPHDQLQVIADLEVSVETPSEPPGAVEGWEPVRAQLGYATGARAPQWLEATRFRGESPFVRIKQLYADFAHDCLRPGATVLEATAALTAKIHAEFTYAPGETEIGTPLLEVFHKRRGVCQDYAHLMLACLRSAGLAARYVSGYLHTSGANASHAWVAVFAPPAGWVEYDPTNGVRVAREHVALAWGRDFGDVSPLRGVILGGGSHSLSVDVAVRIASD